MALFSTGTITSYDSGTQEGTIKLTSLGDMDRGFAKKVAERKNVLTFRTKDWTDSREVPQKGKTVTFKIAYQAGAHARGNELFAKECAY